MRWWSILLLVLLAATAARSEGTMAKGFLLKTLSQDGVEYRYVVYVPAEYDDDKPWPAILFLHGAGECGRDGLKQVGVGIGPAIMAHPERWPYIVILPQKPERIEPWTHYDSAIMAMLDQTKKDYRVDPARLYLTGLSQGGFGTWAFAAKYPERFAAIAPICGGGTRSRAPLLKSIPIWAFHGEADPTVNVDLTKEMVQAVKEAGGDPLMTLYPGVGHNSWDNAYRESGLWNWFLKHQLPAR